MRLPKLPDRVPKWLIVIAVLPAVLAVGIFAFIARYAIAHDESSCPFREVETREVASDVSIREESRHCIPEIEEHRWMALREGHAELELGRFPLEAEQIERGFPWVAVIEDQRAVVTVTNEGRGEVVFREPLPEGVTATEDEEP